MNLQFAHFPYLKRLSEYDFTAQPSLDRRLFDELATGRFLGEGRNLVMLGPPGVGKTHLAIGLGVLIVDEVGYLKLEQARASLLFQAIASRYERKGPIILTSNKAFSEW